MKSHANAILGLENKPIFVTQSTRISYTMSALLTKSLLGAAALLCASLLSAQTIVADPELDSDLRSELENSSINSILNGIANGNGSTNADVSIQQVGDNNQAMIQALSTSPGQRNQVELFQLQNANEAMIRLNGNNNDFSLVQNGEGNIYDGQLRANGAQVEIIQDGSLNLIEQDAVLQENARMQIQQSGIGNELDADNFSGSIQVRQTGGARATLTEIVPSSPRG